MVLEQPAKVHFTFEVGLGPGGDGGEDFRVSAPACDSSVVFATVLIVDDEWDDLVTEALFHHD